MCELGLYYDPESDVLLELTWRDGVGYVIGGYDPFSEDRVCWYTLDAKFSDIWPHAYSYFDCIKFKPVLPSYWLYLGSIF